MRFHWSYQSLPELERFTATERGRVWDSFCEERATQHRLHRVFRYAPIGFGVIAAAAGISFGWRGHWAWLIGGCAGLAFALGWHSLELHSLRSDLRMFIRDRPTA